MGIFFHIDNDFKFILPKNCKFNHISIKNTKILPKLKLTNPYMFSRNN